MFAGVMLAILAALNVIAQMFFIAAYPFWSLTLWTLDILVIYGLLEHGSRSRDNV